MKECKCYRTDGLLKLLGNGFRVIHETVKGSVSDGLGNLESELLDRFYLTNLKEIEKIEEWCCLWEEVNVYLAGGEKLKFHSSNVNSKDTTLLRITGNRMFSPYFEKQGDMIVANENLDTWLSYNGILPGQMDSVTEWFRIYPIYQFQGVNEPLIEDGRIRGYYGGRCLELPEDRIDAALEEITDLEMKLKLGAVIKSFPYKYK